MRAALTVVAIVVLVALLLPPFFTAGECTAEFNALADRLEGARSQMLTLPAAESFLGARSLAYAVLTPERCAQVKPRDVEICPPGAMIMGSVAVQNRICRYYRDDHVRFRLVFNSVGQLLRIQTDMSPYRKLRFPGTTFELDFAR